MGNSMVRWATRLVGMAAALVGWATPLVVDAQANNRGNNLFNNEGGTKFSQSDEGRQAFNQGNQGNNNSGRNEFNNKGGIEFKQEGRGRGQQEFNLGNKQVDNLGNKEVDNHGHKEWR